MSQTPPTPAPRDTKTAVVPVTKSTVHRDGGRPGNPTHVSPRALNTIRALTEVSPRTRRSRTHGELVFGTTTSSQPRLRPEPLVGPSVTTNGSLPFSLGGRLRSSVPPNPSSRSWTSLLIPSAFTVSLSVFRSRNSSHHFCTHPLFASLPRVLDVWVLADRPSGRRRGGLGRPFSQKRIRTESSQSLDVSLFPEVPSLLPHPVCTPPLPQPPSVLVGNGVRPTGTLTGSGSRDTRKALTVHRTAGRPGRT